jgi:hypothetical protein
LLLRYLWGNLAKALSLTRCPQQLDMPGVTRAQRARVGLA